MFGSIPGFKMPAHQIPPSYTPLIDHILSLEPDTPVLDWIAREDHAVRMDLQQGKLTAELFNHGTGELDPIPAQKWFGRDLWSSLMEDTLQLEGQTYTLVINLEASPQLKNPVTLLMKQIDQLDDFPPEMRRVIELYYRHGLNKRKHNLKEVARVFEDAKVTGYSNVRLKYLLPLLKPPADD